MLVGVLLLSLVINKFFHHIKLLQPYDVCRRPSMHRAMEEDSLMTRYDDDAIKQNNFCNERTKTNELLQLYLQIT